MEILGRRRESPILGTSLGEVLGAEPLLGDNDDDGEDYSGLGDALDTQQPDSQELATLEREAQIRIWCRLILDEPLGSIDPKLLDVLAKARAIYGRQA